MSSARKSSRARDDQVEQALAKWNLPPRENVISVNCVTCGRNVKWLGECRLVGRGGRSSSYVAR